MQAALTVFHATILPSFTGNEVCARMLLGALIGYGVLNVAGGIVGAFPSLLSRCGDDINNLVSTPCRAQGVHFATTKFAPVTS